MSVVGGKKNPQLVSDDVSFSKHRKESHRCATSNLVGGFNPFEKY